MPFTIDISKSDVKFLGHKLRIDDCGGQDDLMNYYINSVPDQVFSKIQFLIYVFDVRFEDQANDLNTYKLIQEKLLDYSPNAKIFILLHKIDFLRNSELD